MEHAVRIPEARPWPAWQRAAFRGAFVFWALVLLDGELPGDLLWWLGGLGRWLLHLYFVAVEWPTTKLVAWLALHVFHLTGEAATQHPTGSGDTALAWTGMAATLIETAVIATIWMLLAKLRKRRSDYRVLAGWLFLGVRYMLAAVLLDYGFNKVFPLQFSAPGDYILHEPFGQASPMALLWTFMGASPAYQIFGGLAEVVPGILLLFRRTATLGAMLACAVLLNVVLLNFCYDVPVKLYSSLDLLAAIFLLLPQARTLWRVFILHRATELKAAGVSTGWRSRPRLAAWCLQALVIGHMLWIPATRSYHSWRDLHPASSAKAPEPARPNSYASLDGSWIVDGSSGWPAGKTWKTVTVGRLRYQSVDYMETTREGGETANYAESIDDNHGIHFLDLPAELHWALTAQGATLEGKWQGQAARLTMHRAPESYPLRSRGSTGCRNIPTTASVSRMLWVTDALPI